MKFGVILTALFVASANAQYFSEGWKPGQKADESERPPLAENIMTLPNAGGRDTRPTNTPVPNPPTKKAQRTSIFELFDMSKLLKSDVSAKLFSKIGVNITEKLDALAQVPWNSEILMITDTNYHDLIVNEQFTSEKEEQDRTWAIMISAATSSQGGMSKFFDDIYDEAYNETLIAQDLPNLKWGRIDYLNVTYLTTKWGVWQAPYLVILKDRGQTLRFYRPHHLRLRDGAFRRFLKAEGWVETPPWQSTYGPGGNNEWIMDKFAYGMMVGYNYTVKVPRWVLFLVSGTVASFLLGLMHDNKPTPKRLPPKNSNTAGTESKAEPASPVVATGAAASPNKGGAKHRKGKK